MHTAFEHDLETGQFATVLRSDHGPNARAVVERQEPVLLAHGEIRHGEQRRQQQNRRQAFHCRRSATTG